MKNAGGALLMVPLIVFIIVPYLVGDWSSGNMTLTITGPWGGWQLALVWLYVTVDIPTRSAPRTRSMAISAGVS